MTDVPVEFDVDRDAVEFAMRLDDVDAPKLQQEFEALVEVFQFVRDTDYSVTKDEIKTMVKHRNVTTNRPTGQMLITLQNLGLVTDMKGKGWDKAEE